MRVLFGSTVLDFATTTFSIIALLVPIALTGYAALSVERQITLLTPASIAAFNTLSDGLEAGVPLKEAAQTSFAVLIGDAN